MDLDLLRAILLAVEEHPAIWLDTIPEIDGRTPEEIQYHVLLLCDEGYLLNEAPAVETPSGPDFRVRLTFKGHQFIEAARNEALWKKALAAAQRTTGGVAVDLVRDYLMQVARRLLNLD